MTFPDESELVGHTFADLLGDGTLKMSDLLGMFGDWLDAQAGGTGGQALAKLSNTDGDFTYYDLAPLSNDFPLPAGTADPGISSSAARSDHVHDNVGTTSILVQSYLSTDNGTTFSTTGLDVIDINPSPTLENGHHYCWVFKGEWDDSNTSGVTSLNFVDGSNVVLARSATGATNVRRSGTSFYLEDGAGSTVHRKLRLISAAASSGTTRGGTTNYVVMLLDLGTA